jgi:hypothetical protein
MLPHFRRIGFLCLKLRCWGRGMGFQVRANVSALKKTAELTREDFGHPEQGVAGPPREIFQDTPVAPDDPTPLRGIQRGTYEGRVCPSKSSGSS